MRCTLLGLSFCVGVFQASTSFQALSADIFRSEGKDGTVRYANQALDESYVLYLPDNAAQASPKKPIAPRASHATADRAILEPLIERLAHQYNVDAALVRAVMEVESGYRISARSAKGAIGPMQLTAATAARYRVSDRSDPLQNIEAGIRYLKDLLKAYQGNTALALAAYNAGEHAVLRHGKRIPPYRETMLYVPAVLSRVQASPVSASQ